MATVYEINKGINRSIEFKGFKAQYIIYLAVGMVVLLILFAILYICGLSTILCLAIIVPLAIAFIFYIQKMSNTYGQYGLVKKMAAKRLPPSIRSRSRKTFIQLNADRDEKASLA